MHALGNLRLLTYGIFLFVLSARILMRLFQSQLRFRLVVLLFVVAVFSLHGKSNECGNEGKVGCTPSCPRCIRRGGWNWRQGWNEAH